MSSRIGIMGGMFDPVHNGHIEVALAVLELLQLDQVAMVPCGTPNHRKEALCSPQQRLEMLQLATRDFPGIFADDCELKRAGISYTYDTLLSLRAENKQGVLFLILGIDAFNSLPDWYRWQDLFGLCHFVVINRPGSTIDPASVIGQELIKRQVFSVEALRANSEGNIYILEHLAIDISSSLVRERLSNKQELGHMIAPAVDEYLSEHKLYGIVN